ncbi:MAG: ADP-ribosylglycohydrolase family protein, partial [Bacteroidota bacterium]
ELQAKWGYDHFCESGETFNIDAKLNGAYIILGLLYGEGDPMKTLELTTRCGQDADCNPSNAMAVLGVIIGFDKLPADMKEGVTHMGDSLFIHTDYSFNKAVENTYKYAVRLIAENGGKVSENEITVLKQAPVAPTLEVSFPDVILEKKVTVFDKSAWTYTGKWETYRHAGKTSPDQSIYAEKAGDAIEIKFTGSGISLDGNWVRDGGKADVFLDGKPVRTIDTYYDYNEQEHENITIWHVTGLPETPHKVKLLVKGVKKPESKGTKIYVTKAVIYKTVPKKSASYKFSFE